MRNSGNDFLFSADTGAAAAAAHGNGVNYARGVRRSSMVYIYIYALDQFQMSCFEPTHVLTLW